MRGKQQDFRTEKYIRYGIRKFSFGAASVAIAVGLMFLGNGVVSATEVQSAETAITTSAASQGDKETEKAEPKAETVETVKPETVNPETMKPETVNPETMKPETVNPETIKPETVNPETVKPETVNPETVNSETMKPETVNPETEKATEVKSEVAATKAATKATLANTDASQADVDAQAETVSALSTAVTESNTAEKKLRPTEIYTTNGTPGTAGTAVKTNAKYANSVETVDNNKRGNRENTHSINQRRRVKRSPIDTTEFAQNYGRKVLAGSVTNTGFSVSDPDYPSGMWIDPDKSHYSYEWLQAKIKGKNDGNQIVFSTNRTGDGIVYVTELSKSNEVLKQYTLNQNTQVESAIFDSTIYYNDVYFEMVRSSSNSFVTKYTASKFDNNYYNTLSYFVPKLITQTTYYVDKDGKQIIDSNGNPVAAYTQKGLVGQNYTTSDVTVVNGYYAIAPANSNGVMSPYGKIGASYVKNFHDGVVITYTQTGSDGTMSASIAQNGSVLETWTSIKPSDPTIMKKLGNTTYGIKNPYIPQTSDIKYVYNKLGNWIVYNPDGSTTSRIYPNDPSNPTKIADSSVPDYPVIAFIPIIKPEDHMGTPLVPVDPDDRTKGYIPPTPSDIGKDTTITYTADQQKGSVSYVDDTTGKTLKTDSISGTTGSKSSYSTSGSIADYKKQGYELVTDGYPADLTFDNDDTTDQNFTVHLKHRLTPVNPTDPQTPGAPINPDEPDGPKWPTSTNYDKTVNETISYVDQTGHVVAKQHTDSVNFTRTVVVDNVTGEVITSGAGTTAWTATNGDTTFDAVVSPVVPGSVADKAQTAVVTDLNADSADVNATVTYTKVGSLVPSSSDGNFPGAPTVVYPNDPSDATKVTPAGVPTVPGYTAHDPEGHVLTPGSSYQPSDPTKDTTITYTADQQKGSVSYVDDTTGKTLKTDSISGTTGSKSSYSTSGSIADYKKQGYELVTDGYPADLTFDNDDTTDQNFTVHLKHRLTPVNPTDPQTPGTPINPDNPDGPKWPEGTDKSAVTQTVIRTVNYLDKQTGKVVAKQVTEQVTYNRTAIVDKVTGQIIGYSTTGGDTVDQTDGDKAWTAVDNKSDWDSVTSPDLSSKGYLAPDLAKVAQQTVTPGDAVSSASDTKSAAQSAATAVSSASDTRSAAQSAATAARSARNRRSTVNVYYDHDVVPVNPTNPQTPGTPINPDDPDSPKWPAGTDKNSLTTDVHQTIHYQYGDGSQAAPDKTDSTTFDHQVEIDKVTGEIVKDDGWKAENGKTSFDSKKSPVIPGYTASKPASDSVDGLTQDSKDNVQTIIDTSNQEAANVTYIDDKTGKTLSDKDLTGDYGSTDPYRTGDTIADYEKQGYQLVSDNYPTHGVVYNQDGTVQKFEVHLTHGTTPVGPNNPQTPGQPINPDEPDGPKWPTSTNYDKTVNETISYVDQTGHVVAKQHTDSVNFTRTVVVDNVTGEVITSGAGTTAWTATNGDTTFDAVVSPVVPGSVADKAQTAVVTDLNADSADVNATVTYTKVGSLVPSSSDGNFPGAPTVVYPNDPSDATKVTPAGVPTVL
ncbi:mucin-binding protein [Streptococcus thermophilus]|uniref:mucin-binding protein n=1 Tax=Streptococcus thermophilus TaxID=1308 RepID=UPI001F61BB6C|nr:YSIRK-type signal peptide-containing protein [Streptococcus thermophilus]